MLTFFTTAKPFQGHDGVIQRNALQSWKRLHPDVEVILFGDDSGAAEVCADYGLRHEPFVERHDSHPKYYLDYMFARAQAIARHPYICYSNCDIIFMSDFWTAYKEVKQWRKAFLAVGRRWDTEVTQPLDFANTNWSSDLRKLAINTGLHQNHFWIDFFLFPRGLYQDMPKMIVGHCYWDHWMVWKALSLKTPVVDFSDVTIPVHQNHGYADGRIKGSTSHPLSVRNMQVIGNESHQRSIRYATHRMRPDGSMRYNFRRLGPPLPKPLRKAVRFVIDSVLLPGRRFISSVIGAAR